MTIGVEIEMILPTIPFYFIKDIRQSYHSMIIDNASGWRFENDSSLHIWQRDQFSVEAISDKLDSVAQVKSALNSLFYSRMKCAPNTPVVFEHALNGDSWTTSGKAILDIAAYERTRTGYIGLNSSCGCHIHFSTNNRKNMQTPVELCQRVAEDYASWLKFAYPEAYPLYMKQYDRSYASKITNDKTEALRERSTEFWYTQRAGIEWRAFNLAGAKTVKEIVDRIVQAYVLLEKWLKINYKRHFSFNVSSLIASDTSKQVMLQSYFESLEKEYLISIDGFGYSLSKENKSRVAIKKPSKKTSIALVESFSESFVNEIAISNTEYKIELNIVKEK